MEKRHPEGTDGAESAGIRAEWTAPEVDKLIAGGAEGSEGADVEGLDGLS